MAMAVPMAVATVQATAVPTVNSASYDSAASYGAGLSGAYGASAASAGQVYDASSYASSGGAVQTYATDAQGLYQDPNPQVIRRPAASGVQTYTQNIAVRFLQPPPVPPPGVSDHLQRSRLFHEHTLCIV